MAFCIGRKCNFLPIQKNRLLILRRRDIPRYHFFSLYPHGSEPHRVPSTLFRCNGRIPLSAKSLTCLPLFTLTAPKPSSACSNPPFSAYPGLLCRIFPTVLSFSTHFLFHFQYSAIPINHSGYLMNIYISFI